VEMWQAAEIADVFLHKAEQEGRRLSYIEVKYLVYVAHGWHLAVTRRPLIYERVETGEYGPTVPELEERLGDFWDNPVEIEWGDWEEPEFPPDTKEVIDLVWDRYKHLSGRQLSTLAHQKGTPWYTLVGELPDDERPQVPIPDEMIRRYFATVGRRS
jgi:uncharacterized phage-associated protein